MDKEKQVSVQKVNLKKEIISWIFVIAGGFLLAWFVTKVVIVKAQVPTNSMEDTIMVDDKIVGIRLAYLFSEPKRGDIIIFQYPDNPVEDYVKRVIGLPGETVSFSDNKVFINGVELKEDYIDGKPTEPGEITEFVVPEGHYFMLGDNRTSSWDSRFWVNPFVSEDTIRGEVWFRYSPSWGFID